MENGYTSWKNMFLFGRNIPHYYGDYVRQLFIASAVLSLIAIPLWGDLLPFAGKFAEVVAPLTLVVLAALTSARSQLIMVANATFSAVSIILLEFSAVTYEGIQPHAESLLIGRETDAIILLAALYFSLKTLRAMREGKLGQLDSPLEFEAPPPPPPPYTRQDPPPPPPTVTRTFYEDRKDYNE